MMIGIVVATRNHLGEKVEIRCAVVVGWYMSLPIKGIPTVLTG